MSEKNGKLNVDCEFALNGYCHAMGCYSRDECSARDMEGHPKYADTENCLPKRRTNE